MIDFDPLVNDPRFLPNHGWHDDHRGVIGDNYTPTIQQKRDEFIEFAGVLEERGLTNRCLQLGLGLVGGAHFVLQSMFREVWTVEYNDLSPYLARFPGAVHLIRGNTHDVAVQARVREAAPFDMLFIDAGHLYDDVRADYHDYAPMVRPGGLIAFHDAMQMVPGIDVWKFIEELEAVHMIGHELGIAYVIA